MATRPIIRPLVESDIAGALHLSTLAGWNQLESDWRRLLALWPEHCYAISDADDLIATGTLAVFDRRIGWIGMILVDECCRGQGFGGLMMDHLLGVADAMKLEHVGLDATDQGRPVYLKRGFVDQFEIDRCGGEIRATKNNGDTRTACQNDWEPIAALDRSAVGVDRFALLAHLAGEQACHMRVIERRGKVTGFGLARRGRIAAHVGPIVAESPTDAAAIFDDLLDDLRRGGQLRAQIDLATDSALLGHVTKRGLEIQRRLMRMSRPMASSPLLHGPLVFAASGFELG